jgi:hypothetical protein
MQEYTFMQIWPIILFGALLGCSVTIVIVLYIYKHKKKSPFSGCPWLYTIPCDERCTCANPLSSTGCIRCASYGSLSQRQQRARRLAGKINKY